MIKKICFLAIALIFTQQAIVADQVVTTVTSDYSKALDIHEAKLNELKKVQEQVNKNECEIQKLKKILAKLISEKNNISAANIKKELKKINLPAEAFLGFTEKKCVKDCQRVSIKSSYLDFDDLKTFKIKEKIYTYEYPFIGSKRIGELSSDEVINSKRYTKAGWVETENGAWVKGYKLLPSLQNQTSPEDIAKWNNNCIKIKEK